MDQNNQNQASPKQPKQKASEKRGCGATLLYLIIILGISVILSLVLLFSANDVFAFIKENRSVTITVSEKTQISSLSKALDEEGVVKYGSLFHLFVKVTGKDEEIPAGDYELNPSMDYGAIIRNLLNPSAQTTIGVTIPEGYTVAQIRETLLDKGVCTVDALDAALSTYRFKHDFLKNLTPGENWLEGYLFPDTYEFYRNDDAVQVVNKMLNNYATKYDEKISEGAKKLGRPMHEIVTIASMVEREGQKEDEFAKIAGVIYNRLNSSDYPYLQIDATLQYAIGHKDVLTNEDKQVESPYNTYTNQGLPPGPIASPGYTALYAASHPDSHNYYYYVAMPDGSHLFARTLSEHNKNIKTAKQAFAEAGT